MLTFEHKYELSRLRILSYLTGPEQEQHGARAYQIMREAGPLRGAKDPKGHKMLSEMQAAGLIERRQDPDDGRGHPLFITPLGRDYLANVMEKALFPELAQWKAWADKEPGPRVEQARRDVAAVLRGLPEFRDSREDRIQEVTARLADTLLQHADRRR